MTANRFANHLAISKNLSYPCEGYETEVAVIFDALCILARASVHPENVRRMADAYRRMETTLPMTNPTRWRAESDLIRRTTNLLESGAKFISCLRNPDMIKQPTSQNLTQMLDLSCAIAAIRVRASSDAPKNGQLTSTIQAANVIRIVAGLSQ